MFVVYHHRVIRSALTLVLLCCPLSAQIKFYSVDKEVVLDRLQSAPKKNQDRQKALAAMFEKVGCQPTEQTIKRTKDSNVICILKGETDNQIIVGGHLDHVADGDGIIDDWSGAALLPTLYESLKSNPRHHTIIFVGFNEEELGLLGSAYYVRQMTPLDRKHAKAMVNLECLGLTQTKVWLSHSDKPLLAALAVVAKSMKLDVEGVNVEEVGTADSESFAAAKIPRITIHTVTQDTLHLLHSRNDTMKAIHPDDYYNSYRLIAAYVAAIDAWLDMPMEKNEAKQTGK